LKAYPIFNELSDVFGRRCANAFDPVAREWFDKYSKTWVKGHRNRVSRLLERDIFPWIGARPIAEITSPELLTTIRRIENRGALETACRALRTCSQIFRYSIATGRASGALRGALPPLKNGHSAAVTEPKTLGSLLRVLEGYEGTPDVRGALQLAPLVLVRPGVTKGKVERFRSRSWRVALQGNKDGHAAHCSSASSGH
jgi:integrase